jgi:hypothetical protein
MNNEGLKGFADNYLPLIIVLAIWEAIWKLVGMWKAGRNNQLGWFICIALINTIGILPIVYLIRQRKRTLE